MLPVQKANQYLYKNRSFKQIIIIYLLLEILEFLLRSLSLSIPLAMLFPPMLYMLHLRLQNKPVSIAAKWYLFIPFVVFMLLKLYLFVIAPGEMSMELWIKLFAVVYGLYALIIVLAVFLDSQHYENNAAAAKRKLLVKQLSLLMFMGVIVITALLYFDGSNESRVPIYRLPPTAIMFAFLISCILLKIDYIYHEKKQQSEMANEYMPPSLLRLERIQVQLCKMLEEDQCFLKHNCNKEFIAAKCLVPKEDISYFFDHYIEKDFKMFIAEYRIAYAIAMMKEKGKMLTLEAIAHECGFKSLKTFNKYFQKIKGQLPSEFMKPE